MLHSYWTQVNLGFYPNLRIIALIHNYFRRVLALPFDTAVGVHFDQMDADAFRGFVPLVTIESKTSNNYPFVEE